MFAILDNKVFIEKKDGTRKRIFPFRGIKGLRIKFEGKNSTIVLKEPIAKFKNCRINCASNCHIEIDSSKYRINSLKIVATEDGSICKIGKDFSVTKNCLCYFNAEPNLKITIGDNCMFASDIIIRTTDVHTIRDLNTKEIINFGNNVNIGNHCWIARDVHILKGINIADNVIIGTRSTITKDCLQSFSIYAGTPAKLIKENVNWERETPFQASQTNLK